VAASVAGGAIGAAASAGLIIVPNVSAAPARLIGSASHRLEVLLGRVELVMASPSLCVPGATCAYVEA
jgi:hypothetical protein